ncbi:hypothetical protein ACVSQB_17305 [Bradyrhizobium elkanii]
MNKFDIALERLTKQRASAAALPASVTVGGAVFETPTFLRMFAHDRRKAWASLAAIGQHNSQRDDVLVSEIALALV